MAHRDVEIGGVRHGWVVARIAMVVSGRHRSDARSAPRRGGELAGPDRFAVHSVTCDPRGRAMPRVALRMLTACLLVAGPRRQARAGRRR